MHDPVPATRRSSEIGAAKIDNYEHGQQPIAVIMAVNQLKPADLVKSSIQQLTFKMVGKAIKGRHLTLNVRRKVLFALNKATGKDHKLSDLFNY